MATSNNKTVFLRKYTARTKEKILQNLGKVDRTADEIFDEHLNNFQLQQSSANRLQKEFNNYIRCVRAVQVASKSLMEAITEVYEPTWSGSEALYAQASSIEVLWQDFSHKLGDQVLIPLNTYTAQFPEMRKKIDKRGRKLVDYDSQRHSFQNLQANAAKRKDDVKLTKGREQLEEAKRTYELLNTELHDELPALFDSRILFLVTNLQTLFASEQMFHNEISKIYSELEAIVDKLATESQRGSYTLKKLNSTSNNIQSPAKSFEISNASISYPTPLTNGNSTAATNGATSSPSPISSTHSPTPYEQEPDFKPEIEAQYQNQESLGLSEPSYQNAASVISKNNINNNNDAGDGPSTTTINGVNNNNNVEVIEEQQKNGTTETTTMDESHLDNNSQNNISATTTNLPPGVLYRVKATYKYVREDADELSFDVGEIIDVIEYDDPEDQEDGWLMGSKDGGKEKGMFPANFTRPL
ncbi:myc box-dependent-interacting protein 1 isoform X2 [Chironomus tepperi]|uniref:myc box-dependent-interacting protein 1 isoform X2 n=1 Tax=Chironomus tepperi TaxID=113505 RepID=UPI00391F1B9D